jgi:TrmH family RNA methyltransferase
VDLDPLCQHGRKVIIKPKYGQRTGPALQIPVWAEKEVQVKPVPLRKNGVTRLIITSSSNVRIRRLRELMREGSADSMNRVPIEGIKLVREALKSRLEVKEIYVAQNRIEESSIQGILKQAERFSPEVVLVEDRIFRALADTETPQGIVALVKLPQFQLDDVIRHSPLVLIAHQLQDPGNLGTLIRSAEAFGVSAVVLTENTVSFLNQKTVRGSAGSLFRIPILSGFKLTGLIESLREHGFKLVAASPCGDRDFREVDYQGSIAVFIGNEGRGLTSDLLDKVDLKVKIPLAIAVESLNVAIAASIILCEAARQRGTGSLLRGQ